MIQFLISLAEGRLVAFCSVSIISWKSRTIERKTEKVYLEKVVSDLPSSFFGKKIRTNQNRKQTGYHRELKQLRYFIHQLQWNPLYSNKPGDANKHGTSCIIIKYMVFRNLIPITNLMTVTDFHRTSVEDFKIFPI